MSSCTN